MNAPKLVCVLTLVLITGLAFTIETTNYTTGSSHAGSAGSSGTTSNYEFTSTTTYQQGSNPNTGTTSYSCNTGWFNATYTPTAVNDTQPPVISSMSVLPSIVYVGQTVNLSSTVFDNVQVDSCWANIAKPDASTTRIDDPCQGVKTYTTVQLGQHNTTFLANDTSGNTASQAGSSFIVKSQVDFTVMTTDSNQSLPAELIIIYPATGEIIYQNSTSGTFTTPIADTNYDLLFRTYSNRMRVQLRDVNISAENNETFGIDKLPSPPAGYLIVYAVNNTYTFTNSTVRIYYDDLSFTNEANLRLYKCDSWDFGSRTCTWTWTDITGQATKDTVNNYFEVLVTSFSGFGIQQFISPPTQPPTPSAPSGPAPTKVIQSRMDIMMQEYCMENMVKVKIETLFLGTPLKNVSIQAHKGDTVAGELVDSVYTDVDGVGEIVFPQGGAYTLWFYHPNYASEERRINITTCVECYSGMDCAEDEYCTRGECVKLTCDKISNHTCIAKECRADGDCETGWCVNGSCVMEKPPEVPVSGPKEAPGCGPLGFCWYWWVLLGVLVVGVLAYKKYQQWEDEQLRGYVERYLKKGAKKKRK